MNLLEVNLDKLKSVLGTDLEFGLTGEQVLRNRREFGENVLLEKKNTFSDLIKKVFGDMMMIIFLITGLFDYLYRRTPASAIGLFSVVLLYGAFAFATHRYLRRAQKKVERFSRSKVQVLRGGKIVSVFRSELVPGDILILEKGDVMPCDGIILQQKTLRILEANVTGARVPVIKRTHEEVELDDSFPYFECILFAGSVVLMGSARVFVCNTGRNIFDTENFTVSRQNSTLPRIYDTAMELKKQLSLIWVLAFFLLFAWGIFRGQDVFDIFFFTTGMVISAFPGALEHLMDLSVAYMTLRMEEEGCILRNPGVVDRLCDANCVFVHSSEYLFYSKPIADSYYVKEKQYKFSDEPKDAAHLLENLVLAMPEDASLQKNGEEERRNNRAIRAAAASLGIQKSSLDTKFLHILSKPFDPQTGFSATLVMKDEKYRLIVCGDPVRIINLSTENMAKDGFVPLNESGRIRLRGAYRALAGRCEKVIAVGVATLLSPPAGDLKAACRNLSFVGMFGLSTPISAAAAKAVNTCEKSGIETFLLTDDYPETVSALSKSVSIIGENDYQYALSFQTYQRMDRGVFVADIEKYKAFCGFPAEEKQTILRYHKDEGDITVALTGGLYDTLPQMESDISFVGAEEKTAAVRFNGDILLREKKYELVPLCINWARIFYHNSVHLMQYVLVLQIGILLSTFLTLSFAGQTPFSLPAMILASLGGAIPAALNIFHRRPGPRLEENVGALKDRVYSLEVFVIIPILIGIVQAVCIAMSRQFALFFSGSAAPGEDAAILTLIFSSYFASLSMKFERSFYSHWKDLGKTEGVTFLVAVFTALFILVSPYSSLCHPSGAAGMKVSAVLFALLISLVPSGVMELIKVFKKDVLAKKR